MPKTLKLAFAMGGGVSLGAFSGAALTETIKLSLLRIAECRLKGTQLDYDKVQIDVFSGASAGSLSLAIMLRALTWRSQAEIEAATKRLEENHTASGLWKEIEKDENLRKDLVAAQVAQDLQHAAWVQEIGMGQLLGNRDAPEWRPYAMDRGYWMVRQCTGLPVVCSLGDGSRRFGTGACSQAVACMPAR